MVSRSDIVFKEETALAKVGTKAERHKESVTQTKINLPGSFDEGTCPKIIVQRDAHSNINTPCTTSISLI